MWWRLLCVVLVGACLVLVRWLPLCVVLAGACLVLMRRLLLCVILAGACLVLAWCRRSGGGGVSNGAFAILTRGGRGGCGLRGGGEGRSGDGRSGGGWGRGGYCIGCGMRGDGVRGSGSCVLGGDGCVVGSCIRGSGCVALCLVRSEGCRILERGMGGGGGGGGPCGDGMGVLELRGSDVAGCLVHGLARRPPGGEGLGSEGRDSHLRRWHVEVCAEEVDDEIEPRVGQCGVGGHIWDVSGDGRVGVALQVNAVQCIAHCVA